MEEEEVIVALRVGFGDGLLRPPRSTGLKQIHNPLTLSNFLYILETLSRLRQMMISARTLLAWVRGTFLTANCL